MAEWARRLAARGGEGGDRGLPGGAHERGGSAVRPLHLRLDRRSQGGGAHDRRLPRLCVDDPSIHLRLSRGRHLLVHGRRRLGHRPQLHRLWASQQWRDDPDVRRRSQLSLDQPVLGDHRQAQGQHLLHRADRDPLAHGRGRGAGEKNEPGLAAASGLGRRADQSGGLGMVLPGRRRQPLPGRRHLVADRDRREFSSLRCPGPRSSRPDRRRSRSSASFPRSSTPPAMFSKARARETWSSPTPGRVRRARSSATTLAS